MELPRYGGSGPAGVMDAPDDGGGPAGVVGKLSSKLCALPLPYRDLSGVEGREGYEWFDERLAMLDVETFFFRSPGYPGLKLSD